MPFRKVSRCQQEFIEIIYKVADKLYIKDIEFITEFGCEDVDSFVDGIYKVDIKGYKDGQKIKHTVIIKWHPCPSTRVCLREFYRREAVFYKHIVPKLLEIQRRFNIIEGLKIKFPNCVFASAEYNKETVVVLSLQQHGYRLLDRFHKADMSHASLVMKNLAKLHALSFVLEKWNPSEFEEISELCRRDVQYSDPDSVSKSMKCYFNASVNFVRDSHAREKLKALAADISLVLNRCTTIVPYSVICHADCWNNNILIKYQRRRPVDVLFIDYQLSRIASPVTDISYFLYMCTDRDFLSRQHDQLLDIYYGTLAAVLRQCNLKVEEVYPRSMFRRHLNLYSVLGLIEALVSMKIITAASEEAFRMTEMKYSPEDKFFDDVTQNQSLYVERVNGVVEDFFERGYSTSGLINK